MANRSTTSTRGNSALRRRDNRYPAADPGLRPPNRIIIRRFTRPPSRRLDAMASRAAGMRTRMLIRQSPPPAANCYPGPRLDFFATRTTNLRRYCPYTRYPVEPWLLTSRFGCPPRALRNFHADEMFCDQIKAPTQRCHCWRGSSIRAFHRIRQRRDGALERWIPTCVCRASAERLRLRSSVDGGTTLSTTPIAALCEYRYGLYVRHS